MFFNKKEAFVIAEIGINHDGNISKAKRLILLTLKSGADAVKFQFIKLRKLCQKTIKLKTIKIIHQKNSSIC